MIIAHMAITTHPIAMPGPTLEGGPALSSVIPMSTSPGFPKPEIAKKTIYEIHRGPENLKSPGKKTREIK